MCPTLYVRPMQNMRGQNKLAHSNCVVRCRYPRVKHTNMPGNHKHRVFILVALLCVVSTYKLINVIIHPVFVNAISISSVRLLKLLSLLAVNARTLSLHLQVRLLYFLYRTLVLSCLVCTSISSAFYNTFADARKFFVVHALDLSALLT